MLSPVTKKPESLTHIVYAQLREAIATRSLAPGTRITEAAIANQLQVSKTPVREALLRLREVGLIETDERGASVVVATAAALHDAYEIRELLEPFAASRAATMRSASAAQEILALANESLASATALDLESFRQADRRLHRAIGLASGNTKIAKAIDDSCALTAAIRETAGPSLEDATRVATEHVRIAEAIVAGDHELAAREMAAHVIHVRELATERPSGDDGTS